jgi:hypothetical protein
MFESVRSACQEKDPNWSPFCIMIDKCDALLSASTEIFPKSCVRLCQFHIAQIFLRLKISQDKVSFVFPCDFKYELYDAFCSVQRAKCPSGIRKKVYRFLMTSTLFKTT